VPPDALTLLTDYMPLIEFTDKGLYCRARDFYIDPWQAVNKAVIIRPIRVIRVPIFALPPQSAPLYFISRNARSGAATAKMKYSLCSIFFPLRPAALSFCCYTGHSEGLMER
jgi:hypothetical protein